MKVLILGAAFSTRNMGVGALTASAIKCVKHAFPDAEIDILDYGKRKETYNYRLNGANALVGLVNLRFSKRVFLENNVARLVATALFLKLIPSRKLRERVISGNHCFNKIAKADIAASIAGGDSFSDIYGLGRFFYVTLPQVLVILLGKDLVLLPQTIGPFKSKIAQKIARFIMKNARIIYSRDFTGLIEAKKMLGPDASPSKVRFCHDVAFVLDPAKPLEHEPGLEGLDLVGINISGLLFIGGYTGGNMFGLKVDYRELVYEIIEHMISRYGVRVVLIPHVFGGPEHAESDVSACEEIFQDLSMKYKDSLLMVRGNYDQGGIKHIIGQCSFFIGSRMHACIAALSQCVPAVPIAYSRKFMGVMETIGMETCVADPCAMDREEILSVIDRTFENKEAVRKKLLATIPSVKENVLGIFSEITGTV